MTTHAVYANESCHLHLLVQHFVFRIQQVAVLMPLHCFVWNTKAAEYIVIKVVLTKKQFVHVLQEHAAFGTLNNAVVVCAGDGDHLRHSKAS